MGWGLEVHKQMLAEHTQPAVRMINTTKSNYYQENLTTADIKDTFTIISSLLIYDTGSPLLQLTIN
jgi:hypothetical protein